MSGPVTLARHGAVAVVTIDHPPVNATGQAVRAGLLAAVAAIAADPSIRAAVLACAGRTFVAGADITEFGRPHAAPSLRETYDAVEKLAVPIVAVLHGTALGGGLELALACAYRVIDPVGTVGLPEVTLGLIPGAGGTQRLPRLIGLAPALDMITSGRRVGAAEALRLGLVDDVTSGDRLAFALDFITSRIDAPVPRLSARAFPPAEAGALATARATLARKMPGQIAPARAIDVLEQSAGLDFPAGQALEQAAFEALRTSDQSKALRHVFFAERAVGKAPGGTARAVELVGLVGGGTMGAGIATACLLAGLRVDLVERDEAALAAGLGRVEGFLREAVRRGKLGASACDALLADRLRGAIAYETLSDADLVIEAVFEAPAVKREVFAALDAVAKPGAVLATNTSYLDVAAIAAATTRPGDVIGLHFFSPAHVMKLVEVVVPGGASAEAVATGFAFAKHLGKLGVFAGNAEGFIGNRILSAYRRAADQMVEDGASPWAVDAAFVAFGFPMGVYAMQDMAGLDIGWATRKRLAPTRDPAERTTTLSDRLCERGWFGRKTGRGYYLYGENTSPNPEVDTLLDAERKAKDIVPRPFTTDEIQDRILLAMINEGAKILQDGVALRAADIDVVMVNGYGFPRFRGGPMHAAEARGLAAVRDGLAALANGDPLWRIAPLLDRLAASGSGFQAAPSPPSRGTGPEGASR